MFIACVAYTCHLVLGLDHWRDGFLQGGLLSRKICYDSKWDHAHGHWLHLGSFFFPLSSLDTHIKGLQIVLFLTCVWVLYGWTATATFRKNRPRPFNSPSHYTEHTLRPTTNSRHPGLQGPPCSLWGLRVLPRPLTPKDADWKAVMEWTPFQHCPLPQL